MQQVWQARRKSVLKAEEEGVTGDSVQCIANVILREFDVSAMSRTSIIRHRDQESMGFRNLKSIGLQL